LLESTFERCQAVEVSRGLSVAIAREGRVTRLANVTCTLGRADRPYPEVHARHDWTIALVRRGTFRYRGTATNHRHALRDGWVLLGRPGTEYECSHDHDGGDECASLTVPEAILLDVARTVNVPTKKLLSTSPALPPLPKIAALLERARVHEAVDLDEVAYLVTECVVGHASTAAAELARHPSHFGCVHEAMSRIEARCRQPLSLSELAGTAGLSPFHFLRVFRSLTGTTPHQYLIGARLRLAVRMLLETERPVTRIASEVGFQDLSNFVNTFRRVVGRSPGAYRRR
jgi:AraC family transcriptional regulator